MAASQQDELRSRAEARFKKQQEAKLEAGRVWAEHSNKAKAIDERTARLKALRLAKEAEEAAAAAPTKAKKRSK